MENKKKIIILVTIIASVVLILGGFGYANERKIALLTETQKVYMCMDKYNQSGEDAGMKMAKKLFKDDQEGYQFAMRVFDNIEDRQMDEMLNNSEFETDADYMEITSKESVVKDGYIYITGSIKNISDKTIQYYEVIAKYCNQNGDFVDSDYTNSGQDIAPNESRQFQIMSKDMDEITDFRLDPNDVRFK